MFISFTELQVVFNAQRVTKLKELLVTNNIRFFTDIDGKPFTTSEAINSSLDVSKIETSDDGFNLGTLNEKA